MKPSLGKLSKIIFKTLKHKKTVIIHHKAYNKYLVMICRKMAMKHGKVQKYDLEVVVKYDGKAGIFKAQQLDSWGLNSGLLGCGILVPIGVPPIITFKP